jgi:hypothetical protein
MKIIFESGDSLECSSFDQRRVSFGGLFVRPNPIPKYLDRVRDDPPTYSKLVLVGCEHIRPGLYVMTAKGPQCVVRVEHD